MNPSVSIVDSPPTSDDVTPLTAERRIPWQRRYARLVLAIDTIVVAVAVFGSQLFWLGPHSVDVASSPLDYTTLSLVLSVAWLAALTVWGTRHPRVIGYGVTEYRVTLAASFQLFGALAIVAYLAGADVSAGTSS